MLFAVAVVANKGRLELVRKLHGSVTAAGKIRVVWWGTTEVSGYVSELVKLVAKSQMVGGMIRAYWVMTALTESVHEAIELEIYVEVGSQYCHARVLGCAGACGQANRRRFFDQFRRPAHQLSKKGDTQQQKRCDYAPWVVGAAEGAVAVARG